MRRAVVLAMLAVTALWARTPVAGADPGHALVQRLNAVRGAHGLAPLRERAGLSRAAASFARRQLAGDSFGHRPTIPGHGLRRRSEALASHHGRRPRVAATVAGWMGSPTHRGILLSSAFRVIGAGMASGRLGRTPTTIWVVRVGS